MAKRNPSTKPSVDLTKYDPGDIIYASDYDSILDYQEWILVRERLDLTLNTHLGSRTFLSPWAAAWTKILDTRYLPADRCDVSTVTASGIGCEWYVGVYSTTTTDDFDVRITTSIATYTQNITTASMGTDIYWFGPFSCFVAGDGTPEDVTLEVFKNTQNGTVSFHGLAIYSLRHTY